MFGLSMYSVNSRTHSFVMEEAMSFRILFEVRKIRQAEADTVFCWFKITSATLREKLSRNPLWRRKIQLGFVTSFNRRYFRRGLRDTNHHKHEARCIAVYLRFTGTASRENGNSIRQVIAGGSEVKVAGRPRAYGEVSSHIMSIRL